MNALSFITTTRGVASSFDGPTQTGDHETTLIGYQRSRERCYFIESYDEPGQTPSLFAMNLTGQYAGRLVPVTEPVNENIDRSLPNPIYRRVMKQIAELAPLLRPLKRLDTDRVTISTRVVRRTALVLGADTSPVRKFVVKVELGAKGTMAPWRHHYISTYLRPKVVLERVYQVPNRSQMIAIVSYVGLPYGLGDRVEQPVLVESA